MHVPGVRRATGSKHHLIIDATGIPLAVTLTGGNRNGLTDRLRRGSGVPGLLGELAEDTRNVLLTLARAWVTLDTGAVVSKDAAAGWALGRLPGEHRPALAHAREVYLGEAEENWGRVGPRRVADCAAYLAGRVRELAPGSG